MIFLLRFFVFSLLPNIAVLGLPWVQQIFQPQKQNEQNGGNHCTTFPRRNSTDPALLMKRQQNPPQITCGYLNGDPSQARTANSGFGCRVDTRNGIWGFCPTTVIVASDCGLAGVCVDSNSCKSGCGRTEIPDLTTFTCEETSAPFCSFAVLSAGADQVYSYIACGASAVRDVYLPNPTFTSTSTTSTTTRASTLPKLTTSTTPSSTSAKPSTSSSLITPIPNSSSQSSPPTSSGTSSALLPVTNPPSTSPNNTPAIVGGIIGGLALICITVLAGIFLRRYRRNHATTPPTNASAFPPPETEYRTTPAQVAGLHEAEGTGWYAEKDGKVAHAVGGGGVDGKGAWPERKSRRYTAHEMPG